MSDDITDDIREACADAHNGLFGQPTNSPQADAVLALARTLLIVRAIDRLADALGKNIAVLKTPTPIKVSSAIEEAVAEELREAATR